VSPREAKERFYLVVLHGRFVCNGCSGPAGHKPPHGTIETHVWSAAVSRLQRLATIRLS